MLFQTIYFLQRIDILKKSLIVDVKLNANSKVLSLCMTTMGMLSALPTTVQNISMSRTHRTMLWLSQILTASFSHAILMTIGENNFCY